MEQELDIPSIAMHVIINAGEGRCLIDQALDYLAKKDVAAAQQKLDEADEKLLEAHKSQTNMIQRQAAGETFEYSLLFVHAQDTLMTICAEHHMAKKLIPIVAALINQ